MTAYTVYDSDGHIISRHPLTGQALIGECSVQVGGLTEAHRCGQPAYRYVNAELFLPRCDDPGHQKNLHPMTTSLPAEHPTPPPAPYPTGSWKYEIELDGYGVTHHTGRRIAVGPSQA